MSKTILITGSTDGIGLATAKALIELGHDVLIHGRNKEKLAATKKELSEINNQVNIFAYAADLSDIKAVRTLAADIKQTHQQIDVLINNAGVFVVPNKVTESGLDVRFVVNTIAPYLLTKLLLPVMTESGRVVNLSSAAQAPIDPVELTSSSALSDGEVYAKSKLALTMWSFHLAHLMGQGGPLVVAVNPASLIGTKMVSQAYGVEGKSLKTGADILVKSALSETFSDANGKYFDNDRGQFSLPHPDANNLKKTTQLIQVLDEILAE